MVVCVYIGYAILNLISSISEYSIIISILALMGTGLGLLHSKTEIIYAGSLAATSQLFPNEVHRMCGEKNKANTLCYKEVIYRGYPNKVLKIEQTKNRGQSIDLVGWRGSGIINNYLIYLLLSTLVVYVSTRLFKNRTNQ